MLLQEMLSKYSRQLTEVDAQLHYGIRSGHSKALLLSKLRKKKLILHYMEQCRNKIDNVMQKQYSLEQLSITTMQIEAMKDTSNVFKKFTKVHSIEKIERLQENIEDFQEQIMEINESLGTDPLMFDEDELLKELDEIEPPRPIVATATFPVVPETIDEIKTGGVENERVPLLV